MIIVYFGLLGAVVKLIKGQVRLRIHSYDANGNATIDGRNGMALAYNHLNLPVTLSKSGLNMAYTYDATGAKLKKVSTGTSTTTTDYVGGIQYTNGAIDFIQTGEGIARNNGGVYSYEYNLSDHLGNVRASFDIYGGAVPMLQRDDYYAFGLRKSAVGGTNKYLYNGKELQEELNQYDYGARFYDPIIGRWNVVDELADHPNQIDKSPYAYAWNSPVKLTDPDGNCPLCPIIPWLVAAVESITTAEVVTGVIAAGVTITVVNGYNNYSKNKQTSVQDNTFVSLDIKNRPGLLKTEDNKSKDDKGETK